MLLISCFPVVSILEYLYLEVDAFRWRKRSIRSEDTMCGSKNGTLAVRTSPRSSRGLLLFCRIVCLQDLRLLIVKSPHPLQNHFCLRSSSRLFWDFQLFLANKGTITSLFDHKHVFTPSYLQN